MLFVALGTCFFGFHLLTLQSIQSLACVAAQRPHMSFFLSLPGDYPAALAR